MFLVGPLGFVESNQSLKPMPLSRILEQGIEIQDIRMLSLHGQQLCLPICLSSAELRSPYISEMKSFKKGLTDKLDDHLSWTSRMESKAGPERLTDDWQLLRLHLKSCEGVIQAQDQSNLKELLTNSRQNASRQPSPSAGSLSYFYRSLDKLLTISSDTERLAFSKHILTQTKELVTEVL